MMDPALFGRRGLQPVYRAGIGLLANAAMSQMRGL